MTKSSNVGYHDADSPLSARKRYNRSPAANGEYIVNRFGCMSIDSPSDSYAMHLRP